MMSLRGSPQFALLLIALPVSAASISWDFVPSSVTVTSGQTVDVQAILSGKPVGQAPSIGAFDFETAFNAAILKPTGVTFGPFLGDPAAGTALVDFRFLPAGLEFAEVSLLSPEALDAIQPSTFPLATLSFTALASGTSSITFTQAVVDDAFGNKIPEPGTFRLAVGSLALLVSLRLFRAALLAAIRSSGISP